MIKSLSNLHAGNVADYETRFKEAAKQAEFLAAPRLLKNQGFKNLTFEYHTNTLSNKIYVLACSIFSMIFSLGKSVSRSYTQLQEAKRALLQIEVFKNKEEIKRAVFNNPNAVIDFTKRLSPEIARQFFILLTQRYKVSQLNDLIREYKPELNNAHVALRQLFQSPFHGTNQQANHRYLTARLILENFTIEDIEEKQRIVALMAEWGGDDYLEVAIVHFFLKSEQTWLTSEWLGNTLVTVLNTDSQSGSGYNLNRKRFIEYLFNLDIPLSKDHLERMLADPVRNNDDVTVKLILDKALKYERDLNLQIARNIALYSTNQTLRRLLNLNVGA